MPRCLLVLSLIVALSASAHAQGLKAERPIFGEDGSPVANHTIAPGSVAAAEKLPGAVVAANPDEAWAYESRAYFLQGIGRWSDSLAGSR